MNSKLICGEGATPLPTDQPIEQQSLYKLCQKYEFCSAPICPLDKEVHLRVFRKDERVCAWARELVKPNGEANLRGVLPPIAANLIVGHTLEQQVGNTPYYKRLSRFADTPSKLF